MFSKASNIFIVKNPLARYVMGVQICTPVPILAVGSVGEEEVSLPGASQQISLKWVLGLTTPFIQAGVQSIKCCRPNAHICCE